MQVTKICCFCACLYSLSLIVRKGSVEAQAEIICTAVLVLQMLLKLCKFQVNNLYCASFKYTVVKKDFRQQCKYAICAGPVLFLCICCADCKRANVKSKQVQDPYKPDFVRFVKQRVIKFEEKLN